MYDMSYSSIVKVEVAEAKGVKLDTHCDLTGLPALP
jgi:hypothetical protein